jgi:ubiquinone/menaquinone biosynthesis C-methylase UbiE
MQTIRQVIKTNKSMKPFDFRDFGNLDESEDVAYLIDSMDRMFSLETIRAIKRRAIDLLNLKPGDSAIEVGCGLGQDSEAMGNLVGSQGRVVAIDSSQRMLTEAKQRSSQPQIEYKLGKADALEFPDHSFSAGYGDRVLVSQPNVEKVFGELVRVVKPGGNICVTDIDLGTIAMFPYIDGLTEKLIKRFQNIVLNKFIGRELPLLFKKFGLSEIKTFPEAYMVDSFELVNTMIDFPRMINDLKNMGDYSEQEAFALRTTLEAAEKQCDFLYAIILFTVVGKKV